MVRAGSPSNGLSGISDDHNQPNRVRFEVVPRTPDSGTLSSEVTDHLKEMIWKEYLLSVFIPENAFSSVIFE